MAYKEFFLIRNLFKYGQLWNLSSLIPVCCIVRQEQQHEKRDYLFWFYYYYFLFTTLTLIERQVASRKNENKNCLTKSFPRQIVSVVFVVFKRPRSSSSGYQIIKICSKWTWFNFWIDRCFFFIFLDWATHLYSKDNRSKKSNEKLFFSFLLKLQLVKSLQLNRLRLNN